MNWGKVALQLVGLVGRAGVLIPRYILLRKKGVKAFEKELHRIGIQGNAVKLLSESYKDLGDVHKWIKKIRAID